MRATLTMAGMFLMLATASVMLVCASSAAMATTGSAATSKTATAQKPLHKPAVKTAAKKTPAKTTAKTTAKTGAKPAASKTAETKPAETKAAQTKPVETKSDDSATPALPVPRFVTLGADEVNLRTGPGFRYPIRLVIRKAGLPVEITREFDVWRQIRDEDGDEGWVHKSMLSGRRAVIIQGEMQTLLSAPQADSKPVVRLEPGVIATLATCKQDWCHLKIATYDGWLKRNSVWGVYTAEAFQE